MKLKTTPFERERKFVASLNIDLIQKALWPLLTVLILLSFSDELTTLIAFSVSPGFVEINPLGSRLFRLGINGFLIAYLLKFVPVVPLFYMVAVQADQSKDDFQVRLLKYAAFVVLIGADIFLGAVIIDNNLPQLLRALEA